MKVFLYLLFAVIMPLTAAEPETVSIENLVAEALRHNPELEFYRAQIAAARSERRSAGAWANPELSLEGGRKRARDPGGLAGEGTAWSVALAQPFEFPGRLALRKAIANGQVELAELGLEQFRATLASEVRGVAFRLFAAQTQAEAAEESAHRSQELVEVLVQRDPAGINPLLESRLIEASVITLNSRATEAMNRVSALLGQLNQLRGKPLGNPVRIAPASVDYPQLVPVDELVSRALTNNFELRAQQIELEQQGLRVDLARKDRWNGITVAPFYSEERAAERETVAGVGISIPLPLWNRNSGNIEAAEVRQRQAGMALHLTARRIEREAREQAAAYNARLEEMSHWRPDIIESLRDAAELADRHYRLGAVPVTTYVELQEKYIEALEAILQTRADALARLEALRLLIGGEAVPAAARREEEQ